MAQQRNIAARAGRWSARHRKLGDPRLARLRARRRRASAAPRASTTSAKRTSASGESGRADKIIAAGFADHAGEQVLVQSRGLGHVDDPAFQAALDDVERRLAGFHFVANVESPLAHGASLVSRDRRSTLVQFDILGDSEAARERVGAGARCRSRAARPRIPAFRIEELGDASASRAISQAFEDDARQAEFLSLPITLLILVAAFGTLVAAGLPLLLGLTAVAATIGLLGPVSHLIPVAEAITSVVLLVGLAVGVDYSMFYIRRERDERAAGRSSAAALEVAAATSGRAVLISGLTVMVAMSGMFVVAPSGLPVVRDRDDPRRGGRDGRLHHRRARDARRARRPDRQGPAAVHAAVAAAAGESGVWAAIIRPRAAPAVARRRRRRRRCSSCSRCRRCACTPPTPARRRCRATCRSCAPTTASSAPSRAARCPPSIAVQIPRGQGVERDRRAQGAARARACHRPAQARRSASRINDERTVAVITMAVAGKGTDATSDRALAALRDDVLPATLASASPACGPT